MAFLRTIGMSMRVSMSYGGGLFSGSESEERSVGQRLGLYSGYKNIIEEER
jgi:hypothetical protein